MYIRVISDLKRWESIVNDDPELLPADCFADLKTTKNTLSIWQVDDELSEIDIEDFIVIPALGRSTIEKITYVLLEENELIENELEVKNTKPSCMYLNNEKEYFLKHHYDIVNIDSNKYQKIASLIRSKVRNDNIKVLTRHSVLSTAIKLFNKKILIKDRLNQNIQSKIEMEMNKDLYLH